MLVSGPKINCGIQWQYRIFWHVSRIQKSHPIWRRQKVEVDSSPSVPCLLSLTSLKFCFEMYWAFSCLFLNLSLWKIWQWIFQKYHYRGSDFVEENSPQNFGCACSEPLKCQFNTNKISRNLHHCQVPRSHNRETFTNVRQLINLVLLN